MLTIAILINLIATGVKLGDRSQVGALLPADDELLRHGDELSFCGIESGERMLAANMNNPYTPDYLINSEDKPRGYVFQWLTGCKRVSPTA